LAVRRERSGERYASAKFHAFSQATKGSTCYIEKRVPIALLLSGQQVFHSYK